MTPDPRPTRPGSGTAFESDGRPLGDDPAIGIAASLLLHLAFGLALLGLLRAPRLPATREESVDVMLVSAAPERPPSPSVAPVSAAPAPAAKPPAEDMVQAKRMLSGAALADPKSRHARAEFEGLAPDERMIQLCDIEAMAQIAAARPDLRPDSLIAYARSDPAIDAARVAADGAALHGRGGWYLLAFRCTLADDRRQPAVATFAFRLGPPIPRRDWERLNLPAAVGAAD